MNTLTYPIRGKIISAFQHSAKEVFNNAEIQGILNILFGKKTYTPQNVRDLTLNDCKFEKIIFTTDGDIDELSSKDAFPNTMGVI